jgi:anti-sigma B factor antagonist
VVAFKEKLVMELSSEQYPDVLLITVQSKRIDASGAIQFKDRMRELTGQTSGRVILDLQHVGFVDSSGLGAIVAAMKQLDPGQMLELAALSPTVEKVFRLTRMDGVFTIHARSSDAIESLKKAN